MADIRVRVQGEVATNITSEVILVCQNEKYEVEFEFDESWSNSNFKTAIFIYNGGVITKPFDGNKCKIPALYETQLLHIGVKSSDIDGLHTSTPAIVKYRLSASDMTTESIPEPTPNQYDEIIALLNKYISGGGAEVDVSTLQTKVDENLQTESKEVVGAINEINEIAKRADENASNGTIALEKATTAEENASVARETAERAEGKVDTLDDIAGQALQISSQSLELAMGAVPKSNTPNQLYGTDENGNQVSYPTDSVGTQVYVGGQKVQKFNADSKFSVDGGHIYGNVFIDGNLSIAGPVESLATETLLVEDNVIVANSNGRELVGVSGFAIKTGYSDLNGELAYGIMYVPYQEPYGQGVKIGLGGFTADGKFTFLDGQAQFLATRADEIKNGFIPKWDDQRKMFVQGLDESEIVTKSDYATRDTAGVVKVNHSNAGLQVSNGDLTLYPASPIAIELRNQTGVNYSERAPITVGNLNIALIASLTDDKKILLTDDDKAVACKTIGAVQRYEGGVNNILYGAYWSGTQQNFIFDEAPSMSTFPRRTIKKGLRVAIDETDENVDELATPKAYVDANKGTKLYRHTITKSGVSTKLYVVATFSDPIKDTTTLYSKMVNEPFTIISINDRKANTVKYAFDDVPSNGLRRVYLTENGIEAEASDLVGDCTDAVTEL